MVCSQSASMCAAVPFGPARRGWAPCSRVRTARSSDRSSLALEDPRAILLGLVLFFFFFFSFFFYSADRRDGDAPRRSRGCRIGILVAAILHGGVPGAPKSRPARRHSGASVDLLDHSVHDLVGGTLDQIATALERSSGEDNPKRSRAHCRWARGAESWCVVKHDRPASLYSQTRAVPIQSRRARVAPP